MGTVAFWANKLIDTRYEGFSSNLRTEAYSDAQLNLIELPTKLP